MRKRGLLGATFVALGLLLQGCPAFQEWITEIPGAMSTLGQFRVVESESNIYVLTTRQSSKGRLPMLTRINPLGTLEWSLEFDAIPGDAYGVNYCMTVDGSYRIVIATTILRDGPTKTRVQSVNSFGTIIDDWDGLPGDPYPGVQILALDASQGSLWMLGYRDGFTEGIDEGTALIHVFDSLDGPQVVVDELPISGTVKYATFVDANTVVIAGFEDSDDVERPHAEGFLAKVDVREGIQWKYNSDYFLLQSVRKVVKLPPVNGMNGELLVGLASTGDTYLSGAGTILGFDHEGGLNAYWPVANTAAEQFISFEVLDPMDLSFLICGSVGGTHRPYYTNSFAMRAASTIFVNSGIIWGNAIHDEQLPFGTALAADMILTKDRKSVVMLGLGVRNGGGDDTFETIPFVHKFPLDTIYPPEDGGE